MTDRASPDRETDDSNPSATTGEGGFRSAEEWLADKGVERRPIRVSPGPSDPDGSPQAAPSAREVGQLATEAPPAVPGDGTDPNAPGAPAVAADPGLDDPTDTPSPRGDLGDEVARALAFIRRSTASTPAATLRLERKLVDREVPAAAIRLALEDAAAQGLVDDRAMAAALVEEGREKGHAPRRLRSDLRKRQLPDDVIDEAMDRIGDRDPEAVAFDIAARKARSYRGLDAETTFRRLVGFLARRGHSEGLARKVSRQVVFDDREDDRIAGH